MELYLVTVQANNFWPAHRAVKSIKKDTDIVFQFKVVGEPVIILIIKKPPKGFDIQTDEENVKVSCQPLIAYEDWAKILGVDPALTDIPSPRNRYTSIGKTIYWVNLQLEYTGMTVKDFQDCWRAEATAMLTARSMGQLQFEAFKVPMERRIHLFLGNDAVAIEKTAQDLPLFVNMGDRVHVEMKALRPLGDDGRF